MIETMTLRLKTEIVVSAIWYEDGSGGGAGEDFPGLPEEWTVDNVYLDREDTDYMVLRLRRVAE